MVHFLKQLVGSIYRPAYWYQLILHWAANCLPAGTVGCLCAVHGKVWDEIMVRKTKFYIDKHSANLKKRKKKGFNVEPLKKKNLLKV